MKIEDIDVDSAINSVKALLKEERDLSPALRSALEVLLVLVTLLLKRITLNSKNSSKPPSTDPNRKKSSKQGKRGRKPGGQKGHNGTTLEPVDDPDAVTEIKVDRRTLPKGRQYQEVGHEIRQVIDIDISRFVTEYQAQILEKVMHHQHVAMPWDEFKQRGVYKFVLDQPHLAFRDQIENGTPFQTPSGKIEILSGQLAQISDWTRTMYGYHVPSIPKWIEPWESLNSPKTAKYPFHLVSPHPRWRTHSIFNNCSWLRETYEQEVTINTSDAQKLRIKTGDNVEIWNERGKVVVPAYVTERLMPGVLVLHEGAWLDLDENGVDRSGNPDMLTLDEPSPAGAFAYNTVLCNMKKTELAHRPGWDKLATARSHVIRRDL